MTAAVFLDTNVLVYAYEVSDPPKQQRAMEVLEILALRGTGAISIQVAAEFLSTVTRKLAAPLTAEQAEREVTHHLRVWKVLDLTGLVVMEAVRGVREHRRNYWDTQIWAVARLNRVPVVLSEDFSDGAILEGVRFVNPFRPSFRLADWTG